VVCIYIHTRVGYVYVNIDININIKKHTHTHTHTHTNTHTHTHTQARPSYISTIKGQRKRNLAPVRYTTNTLTLASKVEIIRLIKARRLCVCVCVRGGGVHVFVAIKRKPTFMHK
jgi:hypothetical protein